MAVLGKDCLLLGTMKTTSPELIIYTFNILPYYIPTAFFFRF